MNEENSWLDKRIDWLRRSAEISRKIEKEISDSLGQADLVLPNSITGESAHAYRINGGVSVYYRLPNGDLDIPSRRDYTDDFIKELHSLLKTKARTK